MTIQRQHRVIAEGTITATEPVAAVNAFRLLHAIAPHIPQITGWRDPIPGSRVYHVTIGDDVLVVTADPCAMDLNEALEHSSPHCGTRCHLQLRRGDQHITVHSTPTDDGFFIQFPDEIVACATWEAVEATLGDLALHPGWHEILPTLAEVPHV